MKANLDDTTVALDRDRPRTTDDRAAELVAAEMTLRTVRKLTNVTPAAGPA